MTRDRIEKSLLQNGPMDIMVENEIVQRLLGGSVWPKKWMNMKFNPADVLEDADELLSLCMPRVQWGIRCVIPGESYTAWIGNQSKTYAAKNAARALILAAWKSLPSD